MDYFTIKEIIIEKIPEDCILNRQELLEIAMKINPEFKETLFRNLLEKLLKEGDLVRVGRNQFCPHHFYYKLRFFRVLIPVYLFIAFPVSFKNYIDMVELIQ